ncbi:hypothetical protein RHGRI_013914 [Rhododendron griersonianum]|uniref:non-specific serine/threonine protein kinase n=1 Tax=Rhododendron griersonianum TaxID=479676 RepID=A0AAV6K7C6_9ERIC|nr:hypothetical protein RHGRI_013914 [Rhododendron griersonianum]
MGGSPTPSVFCALAFYFVSLLGLVQIVRAQNGTTPPSEVSALNSVFSQWKIRPTYYQWNISGEPCNGAAIDTTVLWNIDSTDYNPGIRCDCNGTVCHITQLKVYALDVVGGIPEELWSLTSLYSLSLGINVLSGEVPKELGKLTNLIVLYVILEFLYKAGIACKKFEHHTYIILRLDSYFDSSGVSGAIPSTFAALQNLSRVDVSYNQLLAELPSWANNSVMATGSDCIQQNFPCLGGIRSSPKYSNFAINCGGPEITSSSQIVYEWDNETLGPATYYETNTKRWAVSNVGHSNDINNPQYTSVSSSQVITNSDSRLFHTARISPGSLRYFGLGLENGNYSVTLYFAETEFLNPPSWKSLGRRVFDIYIQAWHVHENNSEVELVDARLLEFDEEEVKRVIGVALLCTQTSPQQRPSMPRVVAMLSGDIEVSAVTSRPGYFTDWNSDTTSFMTMDTPSAENEHSQFNACWGKVKMAADHDSEAWDFLLGLIQVSYKGYNSPFGSRNLHEYLVVVNVGWDKLVQDHDSEAWDFMLALSAT